MVENEKQSQLHRMQTMLVALVKREGRVRISRGDEFYRAVARMRTAVGTFS